MTSHDVVQVVRRRLGLRKVGHLGTLDPMATGVLPLALGKATRLVEFLKGGRKVYEGTIRLGFSTNTYDREGEPASDVMEPRVTQEQLSQQAAGMLGEQLQMPPPFSAKKLQGVPAYRLARQGKPVPLTACPVHIDALSFTLSGSTTDEVEFTICCSAGTYVRSVAHDLGSNLGCGAHLVRLRRTGSGEFSLQQSMSLAEFNQASIEDLTARLIPLNQRLERISQRSRSMPRLKGHSFRKGILVRERSRSATLRRDLVASGSIFRRSSDRTRQAGRCG